MSSDLLKLQAFLDAEYRRIGVTSDAIHASILAMHPADTAAGHNATGVNISKLMPLLRDMPDGAGLQAFLDRCGHLFGTGSMSVTRIESTNQ